MSVLLGGIASLIYGVADFLGGEGAKRAPAASVVLWAGVVSFPFITLLAVIVGGEAGPADYALGAAAGAAGVMGLVALFAGLARGQAAAVAPAAAVCTAVLPVVVAVTTGERPSLLAWGGIAIAIPAIVLASWVAEKGEIPFGGVGYGLVAGLGFGTYTVVIDLTANSAELLPLIPARAMAIVVVIALGATGLWSVTGPRQVPALIVSSNGILDALGNVALLLALNSGSLALAAVAASFYPAVTVVMARLVNGEQLRLRQVAGIAISLAALAAIALG